MAIACAPAEHMTAGAGPPSPAVGHSSGGFDSAGDLISRNLMRRRQEQQQRQQQLQSQQAEGEHGGELFGLQQKTFPLGPAPNAPAVQVCWILGCTDVWLHRRRLCLRRCRYLYYRYAGACAENPERC